MKMDPDVPKLQEFRAKLADGVAHKQFTPEAASQAMGAYADSLLGVQAQQCSCINIKHTEGRRRCMSRAAGRCQDCQEALCLKCAKQHHYHAFSRFVRERKTDAVRS